MWAVKWYMYKPMELTCRYNQCMSMYMFLFLNKQDPHLWQDRSV